MEKDEYPKMRGMVTYILRDKDGNIKHKDTNTNIICVTGRDEIAKLVSDQSPTGSFGFVAIGSDNGTILPLDVSNTTLGAQLARATAKDNSLPGTPETFTVRYHWQFGAGVGTGTIWEAGVLNAQPTGGVLHARNIRPSGLVKGATDILDVYYDIVY